MLSYFKKKEYYLTLSKILQEGGFCVRFETNRLLTLLPHYFRECVLHDQLPLDGVVGCNKRRRLVQQGRLNQPTIQSQLQRLNQLVWKKVIRNTVIEAYIISYKFHKLIW